jgi:hypothetical protein
MRSVVIMKKSRKDKVDIVSDVRNIIEDELEEISNHGTSSLKSSNGTHNSDFLTNNMVSINKNQKLMLLKMLKKLFKILYQSPEITELRNKLKTLKHIKTFVVQTVKPSIHVNTVKTADNSFICPITRKIHDNILEMILFTLLSHANVHVKAQIKESKSMLLLYYEVGNTETFPSIHDLFMNRGCLSKSLSLFETKLKIFTQAKVARKISKQSSELDRLVRRVGFTPEETLKLAKLLDNQGFFCQKENIGRPELFQYRLLRAIIQNVFAFETLTCDTLPALMPRYTRDLISPIPKFKGLNFLKPEYFNNGSMANPTFRKYYSKFEEKFEKIIAKNALFRSKPLGVPLKFEDILVESEGEIDYDLENACVSGQLATNPNLRVEEKLIIALYNKQYQKLLFHLDAVQQSALFAFFPGPVLSFPAQVCRSCIDLLQNDPLLPWMASFLAILRLAETIKKSDFEEMIAMCTSS